jgi:hypothetical protein
MALTGLRLNPAGWLTTWAGEWQELSYQSRSGIVGALIILSGGGCSLLRGTQQAVQVWQWQAV